METIHDIATDIKRIRELEINNHSTNLAVGRSQITLDGQKAIAWIVNHENLQKLDYYSRIDKPIYKNLKIAEFLIKYADGEFQYHGPHGRAINLQIFNKTSYRPVQDINIIASDILLRLEQNQRVFSFRSILEILTLQEAKEVVEK